MRGEADHQCDPAGQGEQVAGGGRCGDEEAKCFRGKEEAVSFSDLLLGDLRYELGRNQ